MALYGEILNSCHYRFFYFYKFSEDFIVELLKNNLINNCSAKKEDVRTFYNTNYRQKGQRSFSKFVRDLWYNWYIKEFKRKTIRFDEQWVIFLNQQIQGEFS